MKPINDPPTIEMAVDMRPSEIAQFVILCECLLARVGELEEENEHLRGELGMRTVEWKEMAG